MYLMKTPTNSTPRILARTYEAAYRLVNLKKGKTVVARAIVERFTTAELTLYEAAKLLKAAHAQGLCQDSTHIRRDDRAVGFYSDWHNAPRAAYGALDDERDNLNDWA